MIEKCSNCESLRIENKQLRKAIIETNKQYVEVINESLELHRQIETLQHRLIV